MTERLTLHFNPKWSQVPYVIWASLVAQMVKNLPAVQETVFDPWVRKIPCRREWQPTLVFLPREFHGQRNLVGYSPWDPKELDMTERLSLLLIQLVIFYDMG